MRQPIRWDLYGDRKVDFWETISLVGFDLTGAAFEAQIRALPDAPGSPLITPAVTLTYGGSATVAAHVAAGRLAANVYDYVNAATGAKYAPTDLVAMSLITLHLDNSLMIAPYVPPAGVLGDDKVLAWDMLITPSGAGADKWIYGKFIVRGTVTQ